MQELDVSLILHVVFKRSGSLLVQLPSFLTMVIFEGKEMPLGLKSGNKPPEVSSIVHTQHNAVCLLQPEISSHAVINNVAENSCLGSKLSAKCGCPSVCLNVFLLIAFVTNSTLLDLLLTVVSKEYEYCSFFHCSRRLALSSHNDKGRISKSERKEPHLQKSVAKVLPRTLQHLCRHMKVNAQHQIGEDSALEVELNLCLKF